MLIHRQNCLLREGSTPSYGAGYRVTAYPVGAIVSSSDAGSTIQVHPGHSFRVGDRGLLLQAGTSILMEEVSAVTATALTFGSSIYGFNAGDRVVNLGPDTGSGIANYDASPMAIYDDPAGTIQITAATLVASSAGEYQYYHKGDGRFWELIRDSFGNVVDVVPGFGGVAGRLNVCDYGASGDGITDDSERINAALAAVPPAGGEVFLPIGEYIISDTLLIPSYCNLIGVNKASVSGNGSRIESSSYSVSPMIQIVGADASTRITRVRVKNITVAGNYGVAQVGLYCKHVTDVWLEDMLFYQLGQAEDLDDVFKVSHFDVYYNRCGSGGTAATAAVRLDNRSGVIPSGIVEWNFCRWEGFPGEAGTCIYVDRGVAGVLDNKISNCGFDYNTAAATYPLLYLDGADLWHMSDCMFSAGAITTASGVIVATGDGSFSSRNIELSNFYVTFTETVPAIYLDYATRVTAIGMCLDSYVGAGTGIVVTANSSNNFFIIHSLDGLVAVSDSSASTSYIELRGGYSYVNIPALGFGTNPATTGYIRLPNDSYIMGRNAANSGNVSIIKADADDDAQIGTDLRVIGSIGLNIAPQGTDSLALKNLSPILMRNAANSSTLQAFRMNANDQLELGDSGTLSLKAQTYVELKTTATITASTTQTQGQGALTSEVNEVSVCANANDTVTLPAAFVGRHVLVVNNGAQALQVFPGTADNLGAGVNTATTVATTQMMECWAYDSTNWRCVKHTKV